MPSDEMKEILESLEPCHRCGHPAALDSLKGYPYCSNSGCVLFKYKMPPCTWNLLAKHSNVVQLPQYPNAHLQKVVDAMLYIWYNRKDPAAMGSLEDVIADYETGRPESHTTSLLEHAAFKTKKFQKEIEGLKKENRRLERNSITLDGVPTNQAAVNALVARVAATKKQLENVEVWAVEDEEENIVYAAFRQWMCTKWIEDLEVPEDEDEGAYGIICLNVQGTPDLYGEESSEHRKPSPQEGLKTTVQNIVIEAQRVAAKGLKKDATEQDVARAQLRVMSALLATLSYTLTQTSPTV